MHEFTAATAIAAGGWDARYAVVLAIAVNGDVAAALVDTNGDGVDVDLDEYRREPLGGWQRGISSVVNDHGASCFPNIVAAWGRAEPGELIRLRYRAHHDIAVAGETGWWLAVMPTEGDERDLLERVTRVFTTNHARLLRDLQPNPTETWSRRALRSCLQQLATSDTTSSWCVAVEDAWTEDEWSFCVIYEYDHIAGRLGLRRTAVDHQRARRFTDQYGDDLAAPPDPERFGQDVADFDIGEPLGTVENRLRPAADGINWWGSPPLE